MKRRIIKLGDSTMVLSLPSKWVKQHSLKAGDEIDVSEEGKNLRITTEKTEPRLKTEIDVTGLLKELLEKYMTSAYIAGYDEIKLYCREKTRIDEIQKITNSLIGLAVIEQGTNHCLIGEISKSSEEEFDHILRRIFLLTIAMGEDSLTAIRENDKETLANMQYRNWDINKFAHFCLRILNKKGYKESRKTTLIYNILTNLEDLSNEYSEIGAELSGLKTRIKVGEGILDLFGEITKIFRIYYELFYKFEKEKVFEIYKRRKEAAEKIKKLPKVKKEEVTMIYYMGRIAERIKDLLILKIGDSFSEF